MSVAAQKVKLVQMIPPSVTNNSTVSSKVVDCKGFDYASIVLHVGSTDAAMSALKVQESDDNSSFSDVSGTDFSDNSNADMDGTALALPSASDDDKFEVIHLDLRKRKRYLKLYYGVNNGSTGAYLSAHAMLSRAKEAPDNSSEQGAEFVVIV